MCRLISLKEITSKDNPIIKLAVKLQNSGRSRREHGLFVIEGLRLCRDAAENGYKFEYVLVTKEALKRHEDTVDFLIKNSDEGLLLSDSAFAKISDTKTPQGIICICKYNDRFEKIKPNGRYIALENLSDPSNLGAISRTAEALGISGLILSSDCCDPFSPKSLRASMGALLRLPIINTSDFAETLIGSKLSLYSCVVTPDALSITDVDFTDGSIAIIGNEANGLTDEIINISKPITIKMSGKAESLNAAVAASIVMWEMQRTI